MNIPIIDRSNYLKGLFIIAKLDGNLNKKEKELLKEISDQLGFSRDFYEETVRNLLRNKYIKEEKIKFSSKEIAKSFIEDALTISLSDGKLNESELRWLKQICELNGIEQEYVEKNLERIEQKAFSNTNHKIALLSII
jgi:tellurite resistance protein